MRLSTIAVAAILAGSFSFWSPAAVAQGSPSADQIIKSLMPSGSVGSSTRGIRPSAPAAPSDTSMQPAAGRAPVAAPAPVTQSPAPVTQSAAAVPARPVAPAPVAAPSVNLTVNFQSGSSELTPDAMRTLDELGAALSSPALSSFRFRIEGHTDTVGSASSNLSLSQQRAARVAEYLGRKFGVTGARLEAVGRGQQAPLVQTGDQVAEPRNRRVQVINLGA